MPASDGCIVGACPSNILYFCVSPAITWLVAAPIAFAKLKVREMLMSPPASISALKIKEKLIIPIAFLDII